MDSVSDFVNDTINLEIIEAWDSEGNPIDLEQDDKTGDGEGINPAPAYAQNHYGIKGNEGAVEETIAQAEDKSTALPQGEQVKEGRDIAALSEPPVEEAQKSFNDYVAEHDGDTFEAAKSYFKTQLQGKIVKTVIGDVHLIGGTLTEMKRGMKNDSIKAQLITEVENILSTGQYQGKEDLNKERKDSFIAFHFFEKDGLKIGDYLVDAGVTVAQRSDGELEFNLTAYGLGHSNESRWQKRKEADPLPRSRAGDEPTSIESEAPTLDSSVEVNSSDVNIIILKVTDLNGSEIKELEDSDEQTDYDHRAITAITEQEKLTNAYLLAFMTASDKINAAIAAIDWASIADMETAKAAYQALNGQDYSSPINTAGTDLEDAGVDTYGIIKEKPPAIEGYYEAIDAARNAGDKILAAGKAALIKLGKAKLASLLPDATLEEKAAAVFETKGISGGGDRIVEAIKTKNVETLRAILGNNDNQASRTIFEMGTGITLAKTIKGTLAQIDDWVGITPEQRAAIDSDRQAVRDADHALSDLQYAWYPLQQAQVKTAAGAQTMQALIIEKFNDGYTRIEKDKKGVATTYWMAKSADEEIGINKSKIFNAFLKAALAFGGMEKALTALGADVTPKIELTGKELGEFEDTEEGKKALRWEAVKFFNDELIAKGGVKNIALDKLVEFDAEGRDKVKSFSADPRKLHLVNALRSIVANGKPTVNSPMTPHAKAAKKGVKWTHILKTPVKLENENITVRFLVHEKEDGHLFYDHSVDNSEVNAVLGGSSGVMDSADAADLNLSVLLPVEPPTGQHCLDESINQHPEHFKFQIDENDLGQVFEVDSFSADEFALDSVGGSRMVFNLFIEGEEPEYVEDDDDNDEVHTPETINAHSPQGDDNLAQPAKSTTTGFDKELEDTEPVQEEQEKLTATEEADEQPNEQAEVETEKEAAGVENLEIGAFGPILKEFYHDAQGAIAKLTELQTGEAVAALSHPDVGDIDLVWGKEGAGASDGFGLSKLIKFHPEVINDLQGIISSLSKVNETSTDKRIQLESKDHKAAVRLEWDGMQKTWLLTAFEKYKDGDSTRADTADISEEDDTAGFLSIPNRNIPQPEDNAIDDDKYFEPEIEPIAPIEPVKSETTKIDEEIETLRGLIGTIAFSDALDHLLDTLEAAGLDGDYEKVVSDIIELDALAENAKIGA